MSFINNEIRGVIPENLSFEEKQAVAFAFLKAFYTSDYVGYNVDRYKSSDVTPYIIDAVNRMGKDIITNTRIVVVASVFKTIAEGVGNSIEFIAALLQVAFDGSAYDASQIIQMTEDRLIEEKDLIKSNQLANGVLVQILRREVTNIELSFQGFI